MRAASRWIETLDISLLSALVANKYMSSRERRIVAFAAGAPKVIPAGATYRAGLVDSVKSLAAVMMSPATLTLPGDQGLVSADGVPLAVALEVTLAVRDTEAAIATAALYAEHQESIVKAEILRAAQIEFRKHDYLTMHERLAEFADAIQSAMVSSKLLGDLWFEVRATRIAQLSARDEALASALVQRLHATETARAAELATGARRRAAEMEIEIERLNSQAHEEGVERQREADLAYAARRAQLSMSFEGLLALDPTTAIRLRELEVETARFELEQKTRVEMERAKSEARNAEFVHAVYKEILGIKNAQVEERNNLIGSLLPSIVESSKPIRVQVSKSASRKESLKEAEDDREGATDDGESV